MELIKRIKEAESEAQRIIEQAKADSAASAQQAKLAGQNMLSQAEHDRKKAIESTVAAARSQGQAEGGLLRAEGHKQRQQMRARTNSRMDAAVASIIEYLRK